MRSQVRYQQQASTISYHTIQHSTFHTPPPLDHTTHRPPPPLSSNGTLLSPPPHHTPCHYPLRTESQHAARDPRQNTENPQITTQQPQATDHRSLTTPHHTAPTLHTTHHESFNHHTLHSTDHNDTQQTTRPHTRTQTTPAQNQTHNAQVRRDTPSHCHTTTSEHTHDTTTPTTSHTTKPPQTAKPPCHRPQTTDHTITGLRPPSIRHSPHRRKDNTRLPTLCRAVGNLWLVRVLAWTHS